ncbi:uncharacterized mitochondrial protein AtMg00810-like [Dioscorea cayenensis subsp. rotundata]|uniref:Uncharacterized mitochondrial protein AtMg00810-like n=1 Tax=Dioscorea cayennensis subsp. rotundata TaxID=55577 RepID=A0AB40BZN2_DIOCR|nr:uncharacterized mitochondrial protein AtMg00810-like [Dioscorea cayenensis subsp. rotundata]
MLDELDALHQNQTWTLVPRESHMSVVGSKWAFKTKLKANGTLDRLKARLVAKGYHQVDGIDYIETFSPVIKPGSNSKLLTNFITLLHSEFSMKDLGPVHHFLGIEVQRSTNTLHLSKTHYAQTILDKAQMLDCKPMTTPMESKTKGLHDDTPLSDPTFYSSLVGALQYLTLTRPDLSFSVNYVSQFMQSLTIASMKMVRRILRYVKGSITLGLHLTGDTTLDLFPFFDADWAGCPTTRRSTIGYCTFLGRNIISWCANKQSTISRSSTEAEYRAMANTVEELTWLTFFLRDLRVPQSCPPILFCDNLSALHMTINPVFHARSKHIELDYHFVCERVLMGLLITRHVSSISQFADIFTKPLCKAALCYFRSKLCLQPRHNLREDIKKDYKEADQFKDVIPNYENNSRDCMDTQIISK